MLDVGLLPAPRFILLLTFTRNGCVASQKRLKNCLAFNRSSRERAGEKLCNILPILRNFVPGLRIKRHRCKFTVGHLILANGGTSMNSGSSTIKP